MIEKAKKKLKNSSLFTAELLQVLFVVCLCVVGLISLFDENETVSMRENRMLKTFPAFSFSGLFNGSYLKEYEEAYNDTFPARESFIDAADGIRAVLTWEGKDGVMGNALLSEGEETMSRAEAEALRLAEEAREAKEEERRAEEVRLAQIAAEDEAERLRLEELAKQKIWPAFSDEGYEQFATQSKSRYVVLDTFTEGEKTVNRAMHVCAKSSRKAELILGSIRAVQNAFPDSRLIPLLPPTAISFYGEERYRTGVYSERDWLELVYRNMPDGVIKPDFFSILEPHTDEDIYHYSDMHWTQLAAWYVYDWLCEELELGESVKPAELEAIVHRNFIGDLASLVNCPSFFRDPESNTAWLPKVNTDLQVMYDCEVFPSTWKEIPLIDDTIRAEAHAVYLGGTPPFSVLKTDAGTGRTALVFRDSFANTLIPWLAHHYDQITIFDPRRVNIGPGNVVLAQDYLAGETFDDVYVVQNIHNANASDYYVNFSRLLVPEVNEAFRSGMKSKK